MAAPLLCVKDLGVDFDGHRGAVHALESVSFTLEEGQTVGLVGESGSGKTVTALAVIGLVPSPPGRIVSGEVRYSGSDLLTMPPAELRRLRGKEISMIFQDPMTSLNPLLSIERQLTEVLEVHQGLSRREARVRSAGALGDVGLPDPEALLRRFPHQLSGGMRQRVMIAMALLAGPKILIADEPTTALDVTVQAQILELLLELQRRRGTAILLITHDLGVVAGACDRVEVMYAGALVESASTADLFARPAHPYSRGLLASVPRLVGDVDEPLASIAGQPPELSDLPVGCAFAPRCERATEACASARPRLEADPRPGAAASHRVACFDAGGSR